MELRLLVAAALSGLTVASLSLLVLRPTRRLEARVAPYAQRARRLLGQSADPSLLFETSTARRARPRQGVLGPMLGAFANQLSDLVDAGGEEAVLRRVRQAGRRDLTLERYRLQQLGSTMLGVVLFSLGMLLVQPSGATVLLAAGLGAVWGATRWRTRFDKAIKRRRDQMRAELYTIAQMLAIHLQAGTAPLVAVETLTRRGSGEVSSELRDALDWIAAKAPAREAFERLAQETPEPAAARLYRLLATSDTGASDTLADALLHAANDLRAQRREDVERMAVRRRFQMLLPMILVMGPVLLLFLVAPLPTLILGE
jgi:tight adherence protein C